MKFDDRYASAVRAANLKSEAKTTFSNSDVLGAAGYAAKRRPLALALLRLFTGDNHASAEIVELLTRMLIGKAYHTGAELSGQAASLMARMALDWFRDPVCKACGGHGYLKMRGSPTLSEQECGACASSGKRPFEALFRRERVDLARWLVAELEREIATAGPAAMAAIAPRLEL